MNDLDDDEIDHIRRCQYTDYRSGRQEALGGLIGLLFLEPSLRTRVGFAAAAVRNGWSHVDVDEQVWHPGMSDSESLWDTLRVLSGMVDVVVTRPGARLTHDAVARSSVSPVINGGDAGGEHPTQALIDLVAIERFAGSVDGLHIGISGDLGSRTAQSLLLLLGRLPPARLTLVAPVGRDHPELAVPPLLASVVRRAHRLNPIDMDVVYLAGLPEGVGTSRLDQIARRDFAITTERLQVMRPQAVVLSPMPVIDEVEPEARNDPRLRLFETTDLSVAVRAEVLKLVAGWSG